MKWGKQGEGGREAGTRWAPAAQADHDGERGGVGGRSNLGATKAALKAAKARGVRLGRHGAEVLAPQYRAEAIQRAQELQPIIAGLKSNGLSLAKIAGELNKRKVETPRGGRWDHSSVRNVLQRLSNPC